jgi:hypothetical protein
MMCGVRGFRQDVTRDPTSALVSHFQTPTCAAAVARRVLATCASSFISAALILSAPAARAQLFAPAVSYATGSYPAAIAVADFNGDGKLDVAVVNVSSASVSIFLGQGDGTLRLAPGANPTGSFVSRIVAADFNGDGKVDLAVTNIGSNTVGIYLGNGDGTFRPPTAVSAGLAPSAIAVADLNGDGKLDLVVVNSFGISIHLGRGDGTFVTAPNIIPNFTPNGLAVGDFSGDGVLDLASGNVFASNVGLFLGNAAGGFLAPTMFNVASGPTAVAAASLRGNGALDLVVANRTSNALSVLLNTSVARPPATLAVRSGSPQSTVIGTAFAAPMAVIVRDAGNRTLPGIAVTFTAPLTGASGTFAGGQVTARVLTDAFGVATAPAFTANASGGSFAVVAAVGDLSVTFALTGLAGNIAPSFTNSPPPGGQFGTAYTYNLRAIAIPPASYAVSSGTLPTGLALGASTGVISGTPSAVGNFSGVVTAINGVDPSATQAFAIAIAKAAQSITFAPLSSRTLGTPPFTISATASSGLSVTFSSLTPAACTVTGTTVTLLAASTCTIRASQAGDTNYAPAPNVDQSFAVTSSLVTQAISFGALSAKTLGAPPFPVIATASSGLQVSFSSLTLALCAVSGNTVTLVAAGTCTIRASQSGNTTYAAAPNVDQSFAINALLAQTITFAPPGSQPFGALFTVSATATSGSAVSFASLTSNVCVLNGATVTTIAVGTCMIRASQAGDATYAAAPNVDRSVSVVAAAQTISFLPLPNMALDGSPIELRASASSGLPVSFSSLTPTVCRVNDNWMTLLIIGTCTIHASQAGNANYSPAPNADQSLAVTPAHQSLLFPQPTAQSLRNPQFQPSATASSGLPVTFSSLTPAVCTASGSVVTLIAAGTCTIRATQAGNASFEAISADRSFTVQSASVGVAAPTGALPGPFIEYSTRLGGFGIDGVGHDKAFDVVVGPDGAAWVGGSVASTYFPGLSSATFTNGGLDLLYVARMNPNRGQFDVATAVGARSSGMTSTGALAYVGAASTDQVEAMAIDFSGNVYVAAYVNSRTYPLDGGTYTRTGSKAIFRVSPDGIVQALVAAVDPAVQSIRAIAVDLAGAAYFTGVAAAGLATSINAAIPAASAPAGGPYLIKFAPGGGSVAYATYLSVAGSRTSIAPDPQQSPIDNQTTAYALTVDAAGNVYVAGQAKASDFPVTAGAPDTADNQNRDAFVAKVNAAGSALLWVARLGGSDAERATSIALAPDGAVVIGGKSATLPFYGTPGVFQSAVQFVLGETTGSREIGFVAKLAADASRWIFVAPIGAGVGNLVRNANEDPKPVKVAVDVSGAIYAAGRADHRLPVGAMDQTGNLQPVQSPAYYDDGTAALLYGPDAYFRVGGGFLMKITSDGQRLLYSVIVNPGTITGLAIDAFGAAYVAGYNAGPPQVNAAQTAPGSVFVTKVIGQPTPLVLTATPNPAAAAQSVTLIATAGDARYAGSVEFRDGAQLLGTAPLAGGTATFAATLAVGIHRLTAAFRGSGPFADAAAPEIVQIVNQAGP